MFNGGSSNLKFFKRLNVYKNSTNTVSFNPITKIGRSYNWNFLSEVEGVLILNDYSWSPTTNNHQSAVRSILNQLKLTYICVDLGQVKPSSMSIETVKKLYADMFDLEIEVQTTKRQDTWAFSNRKNRLVRLQENIKKIEKVSKKFKVSQKDQKAILKDRTEKYFETMHNQESEKCFKYLALKSASEQVNEIEL